MPLVSVFRSKLGGKGLDKAHGLAVRRVTTGTSTRASVLQGGMNLIF